MKLDLKYKRILDALSETEYMSAAQIANALKVDVSYAHFNLKCLRSWGFATFKKRGQTNLYRRTEKAPDEDMETQQAEPGS